MKRLPPREALDEWVWLVEGGVRPDIAAARVNRKLKSLRTSAHKLSHEVALKHMLRFAQDRSEQRAQARMSEFKE